MECVVSQQGYMPQICSYHKHCQSSKLLYSSPAAHTHHSSIFSYSSPSGPNPQPNLSSNPPSCPSQGNLRFAISKPLQLPLPPFWSPPPPPPLTLRRFRRSQNKWVLSLTHTPLGPQDPKQKPCFPGSP